MKIAFVVDPPSSFKIYKDSTYAMMVEADARGHEIHFLTQDGIFSKGGRIIGQTRPLEILESKDPWYRAGQMAKAPLADFDAVLMRKDPPFDLEYVATTWLLSAAEREGAKVFNAPRAHPRPQREARHRASSRSSRAPTLVTRELASAIQSFIDEHARRGAEARSDGMGGDGIFRVRARRPEPQRRSSRPSRSSARAA